MKVILQETLEGVGHLGDLINVADGFATELFVASAEGRRSGQSEHQGLRARQASGG